jgi:hypothetical protein
VNMMVMPATTPTDLMELAEATMPACGPDGDHVDLNAAGPERGMEAAAWSHLVT